ALLLLLLVGTVAWSPKPVAPARPQVGIPDLPVVLNGVRTEPEEMRRHPGEDFHYVLDAAALQEGVVYAFTSPEQRDQFVRTRALAQGEDLTAVTLASTAGPTSTFWEHPNRLGGVKQYSTSVFSLGAWSDVISSLETGTQSVRLWEHEGFRGSSFTVPANVIVEDLGPFGWSDVASSIQFLP
ncbi:MAG TPA: hypothetical protein VHN15_12890, partial [Thermoanaerobaculia bacterium]|nr:hypothetical protein [Thermoanaerobaculia bacterium]